MSRVCKPCKEVSWVDTGETKCMNHLVYTQQVSNCDTLRWEATTQKCGYCATVKFTFCGEDCDAAYAFVVGDADPDATVQVDICGEDPIMIYPTSNAQHNIALRDCDGTLIGYAANSPGCDCC